MAKKCFFHHGLYLPWCLANFAASCNLHPISQSSGFNIFPYYDVWQVFSVILLVSLYIFGSTRCRFAQTNVNCLFTLSLLVRFTHRSFPIQSPAAFCLSFTPLIGSGSKKTTLKKKSSLPKPHLHPQKASPHSELSYSCWKADSKKPKEEKDSWAEFLFKQVIKKQGSIVSADASFNKLNLTLLISYPFKSFPEVHTFYLTTPEYILVSSHWSHHPKSFIPFVLMVKQRKKDKWKADTVACHERQQKGLIS